MPGPTFLALAASIDNDLGRNIKYPSRDIVFVDSPFAASILDKYINADASGGNMLVTLPDATTCKGMPFGVKKTDVSGNTVTIQSAGGGQTIDGVASKVLVNQYDFIVAVSDGVNYKIYAIDIGAAATSGAVFYQIEKILKTDGVTTLVPVDGTLINFNVAVDGNCTFIASGYFAGSAGLVSADLYFTIDGVDYAPGGSYFTINGSGGDRTGPISLSPSITLFLSAGPHTVELKAAQTNLSLTATVANPLTLSVIFPGASSTVSAPTPKAATLVVHPVPGIGDYTTIQAALDNLPTEGGYILVREGTYVITTDLVLPDKFVELRGCGYTATIIELGAGLSISGFYDNFDQDRVFSDFRVQGDGTAGQIFYEAGPGNQFDGEGSIFDRVEAWDIERCFVNDPAGYVGIVCNEFGWLGVAGNPNSLTCDGQGAFIAKDSYFTDSTFSGLCGGFGKNGGGIGWGIDVTACTIGIPNGGYCPNGSAGFQAVLTTFRGAGDAASVLRCSSSNGDRVVGCQFVACWVETAFLSQFSGVEFVNGVPGRYIDVLTNAAVMVSGCYFAGYGSEAVRFADGVGVASVITGNGGCKVTELATSCKNVYSGNSGMSGSTIIGLTSSVNGSVMADKASTTTNALVEIVPTITNPKGLIGIGTIKNTDGANTLSVTETFTDAFGTSSTLTTDVAPGNYLPLNLQQALGTGLAPYVSYKAEVIDKVAGNHATYVSHFTSQGSL